MVLVLIYACLFSFLVFLLLFDITINSIKIANKLEKIRKQMEVNHDYLKFLPKIFYKVSNLATSDRYRV